MNRTFKILLLVLSLGAACSVFVMGRYFYNLHQTPDISMALIIRDNGIYNFGGKPGDPTSTVKIVRRPDGSVSWTLSTGSRGECGKEGFFVLDQKTATLWYADSQQLGRISVEGQNTNWRWGSLCPDGKPISAATAKRVFGFTNVPPAFREEVKRVFPKLILPEETAQ